MVHVYSVDCFAASSSKVFSRPLSKEVVYSATLLLFVSTLFGTGRIEKIAKFMTVWGAISLKRNNMNRIVKLLIAIISLCLGGLIYIVFRSEDLLMFRWFDNLGFHEIVSQLRFDYGQTNIWNWVNYNMPACLWLFSYMFVMDALWNNESNMIYQVFIYILPVVAILSELLQLVNILPGTFDILDMASYATSIILFITIKKLSK